MSGIAKMTIMHLSKVSVDTLLKIIGFLFWVIGVAGALSLSVAVIRWVADSVPLPPRQSAFDATLLLAGWAVSRLCAILRTRLKGSDKSDPLAHTPPRTMAGCAAAKAQRWRGLESTTGLSVWKNGFDGQAGKDAWENSRCRPRIGCDDFPSADGTARHIVEHPAFTAKVRNGLPRLNGLARQHGAIAWPVHATDSRTAT
ncbi:MAG: hypothetical protein IPM41_06665 [Sphingomonadales bacterium]|nr:hypothetical protein [Sphingomonadales bacterium]